MSSESNNVVKQMIEYMAKQRGISNEEMTEMLVKCLREAARKAVQTYQDVDVQINPKSGAIECFARLKVVEKVTDPSAEIDVRIARTKIPGAQATPVNEDGTEGEPVIVSWPLNVENFGRIAAQAAKQALTTGLQAAEKRHVVSTYRDQEGQLINGVVTRKDRNGVWIDFGDAEGLMPSKAGIPGELYESGDQITVYLRTLNADKPGPSLYVSRSCPEFVRRLFEREVSEIAQGTVVIKAIAREPGYRSKIAVYSEQSNVDPMGACVGRRGDRVRSIVSELGGEKVDIINWSDDIRVYVANALKPAKLSRIDVDEANHTLNIKVAPDQLSLSIGKKGQNARLAAKLIGWKINIDKEKAVTPADEAAGQYADMQAQIRQAVELFVTQCGVSEEVAMALVGNGYHSIEGLREATVEELSDIDGIDEATAAQLYAAVRQ